MLSFFGLTRGKLLLAAGGAVLIAAGSFYVKGRMDGARISETTGLKETIEAHETRNEIDAEINNSDTADLCGELGGVPVGDKCN